MVIVMEPTAGEEQIQKIIDILTRKGFDAHRSSGATRTIIGAVGKEARLLDPREIDTAGRCVGVAHISSPPGRYSTMYGRLRYRSAASRP